MGSIEDAFRRAFDFVSRTMGKRATTRSQSTLMTSLGNVWEKFWKWRQASAPLRPYIQHARKLDKLERRLQKLQLREQENAAEIEKVEAELLELARQEVVAG